MDITNRLYDEILNMDIPVSEKRAVIKDLMEALELWAGSDDEFLTSGTEVEPSEQYHRATYRIEVLSDSPIPSGMELEEIHYEITEGAWSGIVDETVNGPITRSTMIRLLTEQGSDPSFLVSDYNETEEN